MEAPPEEKLGLPGAWGLMKWRPLVSYAAHFWRGMLAKAGRWCIFALKRTGMGLYVGSARAVVEQIHVFNHGFRAHEEAANAEGGGDQGRGRQSRFRFRGQTTTRQDEQKIKDRSLRMWVADIGSFFILVPREGFRGALTRLLEAVQELGARAGKVWRYF